MRATLSPVFRPKGRVAVPERSTRAPTTIAAIAGMAGSQCRSRTCGSHVSRPNGTDPRRDRVETREWIPLGHYSL
jgi:hypothetical protein